jgi:hypothetical protein
LRFNFRIHKFNRTLFVMYSDTQTLEGVTSLLKSGKHIIMWDLEDCSLDEAKETLRNVQKKYNLADIYIVSDAERSYRAWCYSFVDFKTLLHILLDTDHLDYIFFYYTVKRRKATLRTNSKKGRVKQKIVCVLWSYPMPIIRNNIERVDYDTGLEKRGLSILLGER